MIVVNTTTTTTTTRTQRQWWWRPCSFFFISTMVGVVVLSFSLTNKSLVLTVSAIESSTQTTKEPRHYSHVRRKLRKEEELTSLNQNVVKSICQTNISPISHIGTSPDEDNHEMYKQLQDEYERFFYKSVVNTYNYRLSLQASKFVESTVEHPQWSYTTLVATNDQPAEYIVWGPAVVEFGSLEVSAYDTTTTIIRTSRNELKPSGLKFVKPSEARARKIQPSWILELNEDGAHYAVFAIFHHGIFSHFLIDYLPYIAYMKETLPPKTKIILVDVNHNVQTIMEQLDPQFTSERVIFLNCSPEEEGVADPTKRMKWCRNHSVKITGNGSTLKVMHPINSIHTVYDYQLARHWIQQVHGPSKDKERTIIYYTRQSKTAGHGRQMNPEQESIMIDMIRQSMYDNNRQESLVVFDGSGYSFEEQIHLFQSANIVIGPHGGGMANILFMLDSLKCTNKPKVLEFVANSFTESVQDGGLGRTYYDMFSAAPWVEYHHIMYIPPSNDKTTFVDLVDFQHALNEIMSKQVNVHVPTTTENSSTTISY